MKPINSPRTSAETESGANRQADREHPTLTNANQKKPCFLTGYGEKS
jgi:hypothetical protein